VTAGHTLDRPVWNSLNSRWSKLAVAQGAAVRLDPRYGPFAAARDTSDEAQLALAATLTGPGDEIWLVEPEDWPAPPGTRVARTARLLQMIAETPAPLEPGDLEDTVLLGEADAEDMTSLALATEPGPWRKLTHRYGDYYGIREGGSLAAMAGERMLPAPGLAELSGVCTWPQWRGRGFAARLIRRVLAGFAERGDTPFLHSYADNGGAIGLYESLGFRPRCKLVVTVLTKA
jgi:ribosomal protein S18 acetylase RimI-like enzyme